MLLCNDVDDIIIITTNPAAAALLVLWRQQVPLHSELCRNLIKPRRLAAEPRFPHPLPRQRNVPPFRIRTGSIRARIH
jgi:hypothetical protein